MERLTHKGARDLDYIGWDYQHVLYKLGVDYTRE
jgi:hypothetical protein